MAFQDLLSYIHNTLSVLSPVERQRLSKAFQELTPEQIDQIAQTFARDVSMQSEVLTCGIPHTYHKPADWIEDCSTESSSNECPSYYWHTCIQCNLRFTGGLNRTFCKLCAPTPPSLNECPHKHIGRCDKCREICT